MLTQIFALVLGLAFTWVGFTYVALGRRMRGFRAVPGQILSREVGTVPSGDTTTGRWGKGGGYTPKVTYRYVVDGRTLESDRIGFAIEGLKREIAEQRLAAIPDAPTVWYDPAKPEVGYLRKHSSGPGYLLVALGVSLVGGALVALLT